MKKFAFVNATEESAYEYWKNEFVTKAEAVDAFVRQANDYGVLGNVLEDNHCKNTEELGNLDECDFVGESEQGYIIRIFFGNKTKNIYNWCRRKRAAFIAECY
ncbi:MAG: hypothetical protein MJ237_06065 [bacterium]|nr:hypothetical protein [bacterium]